MKIPHVSMARFCIAILILCSSPSNMLNALPAKCDLKVGDPVSKVQEFLNTKAEPQHTDHLSYFKTDGFWIFLDAQSRVRSFRFEKPFNGKIHGVAIDQLASSLDDLLGKPHKQFQGFPDAEGLRLREARKDALISELPDPVPKRLVVEVMDKIRAIDKEPFPFLTALVYSDQNTGLFRVDASPVTGKVQIILASFCWD